MPQALPGALEGGRLGDNVPCHDCPHAERSRTELAGANPSFWRLARVSLA